MGLRLSHAEAEQVEALQEWWRIHREWIIGAVIGAVAVGTMVGGGRWWLNQQRERAATVWTALERAVSERSWESVEERLAELQAVKWVGRKQVPLAALRAAGAAAEAGEWSVAERILRRGLMGGEEGEIRGLVQLRLAGVYLAMGEEQNALATLGDRPIEGFSARWHELRAEALTRAGRREEAAASWKAAREEPEKGGWQRVVVAKEEVLTTTGGKL
ncbi:MAG: tetratricopeptide repeat protein [Hydrogenophilus sp.]|nr:tetratricopeptide repeat protein [Hydrogenophilus sp.]